MPLKVETLQSQLERAQAALKVAESNVGEQTPKKNPAWRRANSRVKQIEERINSRKANARPGGTDEDASEE